MPIQPLMVECGKRSVLAIDTCDDEQLMTLTHDDCGVVRWREREGRNEVLRWVRLDEVSWQSDNRDS